jgi:diaminopimelate decarboxylase
MLMGGRPSAFGFDEERLEEVARRLAGAARLRLRGLHMFAGTQILDARVLVGQWRHAVELARRLAGTLGGPLETVDLGAGSASPTSPRTRHSTSTPSARRPGSSSPRLTPIPASSPRGSSSSPGRFLAGPAGSTSRA